MQDHGEEIDYHHLAPLAALDGGRRRPAGPEVVDGLVPVEYVGDEAPAERALICTVHDGGQVPGELLDGEDALLERREVRCAHAAERDWGANLVAGHLARELGLGGFAKVNLARLMLDFARFPGCSRPGAPHLLRKSIFPPMAELLSPETKHRLLDRYYESIDRDLERRFAGKALIVAVHTYDKVERPVTYRPEVSLVTGTLASQPYATPAPGRLFRDPVHGYDPLYPMRLCDAACDPLLSCRMAFDVEQSGRHVSINYPYAMADGCVEVRTQVRCFFRYLRRRFEEAFPGSRDRTPHRRVWEMLLDVTGRSIGGGALRRYIHRGRRAMPERERLFADARDAYCEIARFLAENEAELLRDYRFARERPSSLALEIRKDLLCEFDAEGRVLGLRSDADQTARDLARQLAGAITSYLWAVCPDRSSRPSALADLRQRVAA